MSATARAVSARKQQSSSHGRYSFVRAYVPLSDPLKHNRPWLPAPPERHELSRGYTPRRPQGEPFFSTAASLSSLHSRPLKIVPSAWQHAMCSRRLRSVSFIPYLGLITMSANIVDIRCPFNKGARPIIEQTYRSRSEKATNSYLLLHNDLLAQALRASAEITIPASRCVPSTSKTVFPAAVLLTLPCHRLLCSCGPQYVSSLCAST